MDKTEKIKSKNNNLAHLVSLISIIVLLLCLCIVLVVRFKLKNVNEEKLISDSLTESIQNNDGEEMTIKLEEVERDLETLESALNDTTSAINTLYDESNSESKEQTKESITKVSELDVRIENLKKEVAEMMKGIKEDNQYDATQMLDKFTSLFGEMEALKKDVNNNLSDIAVSSKDKQEEIMQLVRKMQEDLNSQSQNSFNDLTGNIQKLEDAVLNQNKSTESSINSYLKDMENNFTNQNKNTENNLSMSIKNIENTFFAQNKDTESHLLEKMDSVNGTVLESLERQNGTVLECLEQQNGDVQALLNSLLGDVNSRFDSVDQMLNEVFQCVANGKRTIASALATIGTDVGKDSEGDDYNILGFSELGEKIEHSQDIYGEFEKDGEMMAVNGAIENNLPVGVAAWVSGNYVIGNGKDIDDAYNRGYIDGRAQIDNARIEYIYHNHTGNANEGGGCYQREIRHNHTSSCYESICCNGTIVVDQVYFIDGDPAKGGDAIGHCVKCNHVYYSEHYTSYNPVLERTTFLYSCYQGIGSKCICPMADGQLLGYSLSCGKNENSIDRATIVFD